MTTIYELEKQATPGPYTAIDHCVMAGSPKKYRTLAFCYDDDPPGTELDTHAETTALLLVHCRNNFMPLLAYFKRIVRDVEEVDPAEAYSMRKLIAELEEVK